MLSLIFRCSIVLLAWNCQPASGQIRCRLTAGSNYFPGLVASGGLASLFCTGLERTQGLHTADGFPLPFELAGVRVKIAGVDAPILAVADFGNYQQINFQSPIETDDRNPSGDYPYEVTRDGGRFQGYTRSVGPALFEDANGFALAQHASDFSLVTRENPARAGEYIILYGTGLTNYSNIRNSPPFGIPAPFQPLSSAQVVFGPTRGPFLSVSPPTGSGTRISFSWAGLVPGVVGVFQINFQMPARVSTGKYSLLVEREYEEIMAVRLRTYSVYTRRASLWVAE